MSSARYPGHRNFTLVRECACCHTKTIVTYFTSKICWQLYVKLLIWLQFKYISRNETRTPKFFALLISSNIFHWQDLQHLKKCYLFVTLFREKRTGNLKFPHIDISSTLNKPRNLIGGFVLVMLDFSLTRKEDATLSKR